MAQKKGAEKTRAKKNPRKNEKIKKDIKRAVENIPGLLVEHVGIENMKKTEAKKKLATHGQSHQTQSAKSSKIIIWFGVGSLTLIIFAMWIWNTKTLFYDIGYAKSTEKELWESTTNDLGVILSGMTEQEKDLLREQTAKTEKEINKKIEEENKKEKIKQTLSALINSVTTTPSSTTPTSTE